MHFGCRETAARVLVMAEVGSGFLPAEGGFFALTAFFVEEAAWSCMMASPDSSTIVVVVVVAVAVAVVATQL